jgi:ABC-type sugar transport system substrate-binding protein
MMSLLSREVLAVLRRLLVSVALLGVCVAAGGEVRAEPTSGEAASVVFLNPGKRGEVFWDMVAETMQGAGRQLGLRVEVIYAERNYRLMQSLGYEVIEREKRPQYMVLANEENAGAPLLAAADAAGIRTLLISSDIIAEDRKRYGAPREVLKNWIGSLIPDVEAAGERMAQQLIAEARRKALQSSDGKLHILALGGDERTPSWLDRQRGLERALAAAPDVVVDRLLYAHWNAAEAEDLTGKHLAWAGRRGIRLAGVWAGNDLMALGAMTALRAGGSTPGADTVVVGLNWSRDGVERVRDGSLLLTDGGHFLLGTWSMIMLRDYLDGCDPFTTGRARALPTAAVTRANASLIATLLDTGGFAHADVSRLRAKRADGSCRPYDFSMDALFAALGAHPAE